MDLAEATWTEVADADAEGAFLPVGSTEQHGPHAPLGTDTLTAEAVAAAGADAFAGEVLVAPAVPVGIAQEHRAFDGTMWVREDTFRAYVRDCVASLADHVDPVVVVNGHGGNVGALREVAAGLTREGTARVAAFTWFDAIQADVPMGHGGARETAVLRATWPELVREDRVEAALEGGSDGWGVWAGGVNVAYDSDEFTENGVVGDPTAGSAELGGTMLAEAGESLAELLSAMVVR